MSFVVFKSRKAQVSVIFIQKVFLKKNSKKFLKNFSLLFSCCGAGTAADMVMTSRWVEANMEMHRRNTNRKAVPVEAAVTFVRRYLYSFQGKFQNYLIFGGVDHKGPHIRVVHPHGSVDCVPYGTLGSGCLAAMSIMESRWKPDMTQEEAMKLVCDATSAGVYNDLGSGFGVDIVIIRKDSHKVIRGLNLVEKEERKLYYTPNRGATGVLSCKKIAIEIEEEVVEHAKMEVD